MTPIMPHKFSCLGESRISSRVVERLDVKPNSVEQSVRLKIVEQPSDVRFRYKKEKKSSPIPGVNSSRLKKTYPTIQIGYDGRAVIVVSCVTKDPPYRPHPYKLFSKNTSKNGVCTFEVSNASKPIVLKDLRVHLTKKNDIANAFRERQIINVDPFKTGFQHMFQMTSGDMNAVRLCFQVFLTAPGGGISVLPPVVSDVIHHVKNAEHQLTICSLSHCSAPVSGGQEIILLCDEVSSDDIVVRLYEERCGRVVWEAAGEFGKEDVHKRAAICFRTPSYCDKEVDEPVSVFIQLLRPSDCATSRPLPFELIPDDDARRRRRAAGAQPAGDSARRLARPDTKTSKPDLRNFCQTNRRYPTNDGQHAALVCGQESMTNRTPDRDGHSTLSSLLNIDTQQLTYIRSSELLHDYLDVEDVTIPFKMPVLCHDNLSDSFNKLTAS